MDSVHVSTLSHRQKPYLRTVVHLRPGVLRTLVVSTLLSLASLAPVRCVADVLRPPDSLHRSSRRLRPNWDSLIFTRLDPGDTRLVPGSGGDDRRRRRSGGVQLTPTQLLSLMSGSLTYQQDRHSVAQTLTLLKQLGVKVVLKQPRKRGAAGEWIPHTRTIRIRPDIPSMGSRAFARVLNHEVIHVAQSCKGGGLSGFPVTLGLGGQPSRASLQVLNRHPVYARAPQRVRQVEIEAFANQDRLDLGPSVLRSHCIRS